MISVGHGEKVQIPVENCTTRSLEDMSQSMTTAEDPCAMMHVVHSLQSYSGLLKEMVQPSHLQLSRHIELVVKMGHMVDVVLLLMLVEEVATLLDA
jgi:hypothetical protein